MKTCAHPDCENPRWYGPNGTNAKLTMCEQHQRAYWRQKKAERYIKKAELRSAGLLPPPQKRGRPPKAAPIAAPPPPIAAPKFEQPKQKARGIKPAFQRKTVKVLLLDYNTREMIHFEGEIVLKTPMPDNPLATELLLEGYEDYLVVQRGDAPEVGLMSLYGGGKR